jgi:hypothetical protein
MLAVATSEHFHLSHLLRLLGSGGVLREGSSLIRVFAPQGNSLVCLGNNFNCRLSMPMEMLNLNTISQ